MNLRNLEKKDAELMLEWMHDEDVVHDLSANFPAKTIDDCYNFIENANSVKSDLNLAIVNEFDEYMGTVSLKHIDHVNRTAEFAVTIRKCAMGKGYSAYGMKKILELGINELALEKIYWCVSHLNERAVKFYDKNMYVRTDEVPENIRLNYTKEQNEIFIWYVYP